MLLREDIVDQAIQVQKSLGGLFPPHREGYDVLNPDTRHLIFLNPESSLLPR
jgi:hypothetical protein